MPACLGLDLCCELTGVTPCQDMAEIRVFHQDRFLCRAICPELAGEQISLKEIIQARNARRKQVQAGLSEREAFVEQFLVVHQPELLYNGFPFGESCLDLFAPSVASL